MGAPDLAAALAVHARQRDDETFTGIIAALVDAELLIPYMGLPDGSPPPGRPTSFQAATVTDADGNSGQPAFGDESALLRWSGGRRWPAFPVTTPTLFDVADGGGRAVVLNPGDPDSAWLPPELVKRLAELFYGQVPQRFVLDAAARVEPATWVPSMLGPALSWHLAQRPEVAFGALFDAVHEGERWPVCGMVFDEAVPPPIRVDAEIAMRQRLNRAIGDGVQPWFVALEPPVLQRVQSVVQPFYVRGSTPVAGGPPPPEALRCPALEERARLQELVDGGLLNPTEAALHASLRQQP